MVEIETWIKTLQERLLAAFGERLAYIGLQGSYRRGEADEASDIDVMVVLDTVTAADLRQYRAIVAQMEEAEKACGFIGGREELLHWPKHELFLLVHETQDCYGHLRDMVPAYGRADIESFVRINTANLYHALCHGYLYSENETARFAGCYKAVFYILQNLHYLQTGAFAATKRGLLVALCGEDKAVLDTALRLRAGERVDMEEAFSRLLCWCQSTLADLPQ